MAFNAEQLREHRRKLRARGICTTCHRNPAGEGRRICTACVERSTARLRAYKRKWADTPGRCFDCGKRIPLEARACRTCRAGNLRRKNRYRRKNLAEGRCAACGRAMGAPGYYCPPCRDVASFRERKRRALGWN